MSYLIFSGNILSGKDSSYAVHSFCSRGVDGKNSGAWVFASQNCYVKHSLQIVVIRVFSIAQNLLLDINPVNAGTHFPVIRTIFRNGSLSHDFCSQLDCCNDFYISGTAAVVVAQSVTNFFFCRIRIFVQKSLGAHNHSRNTEAALYCSCLSVGIGKHLALPLCQALNGNDIFSFQSVCVRYTCLYRFSVNDYGTGTARALTATVFY